MLQILDTLQINDLSGFGNFMPGDSSETYTNRRLAQNDLSMEMEVKRLMLQCLVVSILTTFAGPSAKAQDNRLRGKTAEGKRPALGSPYVELDSWMYPAIERLAALGYIRSEFLGMKPWTRLECAFLVVEAGTAIQYEGGSTTATAKHLHDELENDHPVMAAISFITTAFIMTSTPTRAISLVVGSVEKDKAFRLGVPIGLAHAIHCNSVTGTATSTVISSPAAKP
jgi:hypothetical protein